MSVKELILHTFKGYALEGRFEGLCSQHQQVFPTVLIPLFIEHGNIYIYMLNIFNVLDRETSETGLPMVRPLFLQFPEDPQCHEEQVVA